MKSNNPIIILLFLTGLLVSCESQLNEDVFSQLSPETLKTEKGIKSLLVSAYDHIHFMDYVGTQYNYMGEVTTDIFWETGGGHNTFAQPLIDFVWDSSHQWLFDTGWQLPYRTIRDANLVLEHVDEVPMAADEIKRVKGEATALRGFAYLIMYNWFGPVPLVVASGSDNLYVARASDAEMQSFLEAELTEAVSLLPVQSEYGRVTKGAAMSMLCKYYLNTKQWQKCADMALQVIQLGEYSLFPDYTTMFDPANEGNSEMIFVFPSSRLRYEGNTWMAFSRPPNYPMKSNQINFAAQFRYYDSFVNSFLLEDERRKLFLTEYTDTNGNFIQLLGNDNSRSFKYDDPDSNAEFQENDFAIIRYADILLSRAEALNELNGPNQESIELINQVRKRAKVPALSLADFPDKDKLRTHLLDERGWEFYSESLRREDLIRHGKYIEQAVRRGKPAKDYHRLYPIPQREMDANPNVKQNNGYE